MEDERGTKSKRREDKEERRKRRKKEKGHKSQSLSQQSEQESIPPATANTLNNEPIVAAIEEDHVMEEHRHDEALERPRITPASQTEDSVIATELTLTEQAASDASPMSLDDGAVLSGSPPLPSLLNESTLRSLVDAQFQQLSAQIDALEVCRQALAPYVSDSIKTNHVKKRRSAATAPSTPGSTSASTPREKKKSGYLIFLAEMKAHAREGRSKIDEQWRALSPEEKQKWNLRAMNAANEKAVDSVNSPGATTSSPAENLTQQQS